MSDEKEVVRERQENKVWYVHIDNWHPTPLNRLMNSHWAVRNRMKKHDANVIAFSVLGAAVPKAQTKRKVSLEIILAPRQRAADPDAYFKTVNDALVQCGALCNDSHAWVELGGVVFTRGERKATIIRLENLQIKTLETRTGNKGERRKAALDEVRDSKKSYRYPGIRLKTI